MVSNFPLLIGWAQTDITPEKPVLVAGQFAARLSEEVLDPLQTVALALQSGDEQTVMVCSDLLYISDELRLRVLRGVQAANREIDPKKIILNATHTHTAPETVPAASANNHFLALGEFQIKHNGIELDAMPVEEYLDFAAGRIVEAIEVAWQSRAPGGIAYGSGYAVLGRNRRWVDFDGFATMYRLDPERFSHIEGFEDHSVNLLATYDSDDNLTGIVFNAPMTAQETGGLFAVSADLWCEARRELRARFGEGLYVLPQVSAAGELTTTLIYDKATHERMLQLKGRTGRQEAAYRIAQAAQEIVPYLSPVIERTPVLRHLAERVELPVNVLTEQDVEEAQHEIDLYRTKYDEALCKLEENPALKQERRWYAEATWAFRHMTWYEGVIARYQRQSTHPTYAAEVHVVRLGDVVFASNPFEYYLDFGIQIKTRSPALQTFIVQLAGPGTYVPSARSAQGGGYGSVPASNPIGAPGGQVLANETVRLIRSLWGVPEDAVAAS